MSNNKENKTTKVLSGIFASRDDIEGAVADLYSAGIKEEDLLVATENKAQEVTDAIETEPESAAVKGAGIGALGGTALGAIAGLSMAVVPGFGALLAAGLIGSASGLTLGSYLGAIYGSRFATQIEYDLKDELANGAYLLLVSLDAHIAGEREKFSDYLAAHSARHINEFEIEVSELKRDRPA